MGTVRDFKTDQDGKEAEDFRREFSRKGFLLGPPVYSGATSSFSCRFGHTLDSQLYLLEEGREELAGRSGECRIQLPQIKFYSRKHARLTLRTSGLHVLNLSSNCTYLGGAPFVKETNHDDYIKLSVGDDRIAPPNSLIRFSGTLSIGDDDPGEERPDMNLPWMYLAAPGMWRFMQRQE